MIVLVALVVWLHHDEGYASMPNPTSSSATISTTTTTSMSTATSTYTIRGIFIAWGENISKY